MPDPPHANPEVPDADALDQDRPVVPEPADPEPPADPEVPEADALDQGREAPLPEPE